MTAEVPSGTKIARVSRGTFQLLQVRRGRERGRTDFAIKGLSFRDCPSPRRYDHRTGRAHRSSEAFESRHRRRKKGGIRIKSGGRHGSRGGGSHGASRGTVWASVEFCNGTLTRVYRGSVRVRDLRRKRTILLRAPRSYFASR
jgi:hypothetical protein